MFEEIKKKYWIRKQKKYLKNRIDSAHNYLDLLDYRKRQPMAPFRSDTYGGFGAIKLTTLTGKEIVIMGTGKSNTKQTIKFLYKELYKLSKFSHKNLMSEDNMIGYLYYLNDEVNSIEEKLDNELIEIINLFEKNIKNKIEQKNNKKDLIETVNNKINFIEYKNSYIKHQNILILWTRYFRKNISEEKFNEYYGKLNLRTWDEMKLKIDENVRIKNNKLLKVSNKLKTGNEVLDYKFNYETLKEFINKEKIDETTCIDIVECYLNYTYIKSKSKVEVAIPSILVNKFNDFLIDNKNEQIIEEYKYFQSNILKFQLPTGTNDLDIEIIKQTSILNLIKEMKDNNLNYKKIFKLDFNNNIQKGYSFNISINENRISIDYIQIKNIPAPKEDKTYQMNTNSSSTSSSDDSSNTAMMMSLLSAVG